MKQAPCPECDERRAVYANGRFRPHISRGVRCSGSDTKAAKDTIVESLPPAEVVMAAEGEQVGRSTERMLDQGRRVPVGHGEVSILFHLPLDPEMTAQEQAALLYEDPNYLYQQMAAVPNTQIRLTMRTT